jgi:hypothetical protein
MQGNKTSAGMQGYKKKVKNHDSDMRHDTQFIWFVCRGRCLPSELRCRASVRACVRPHAHATRRRRTLPWSYALVRFFSYLSSSRSSPWKDTTVRMLLSASLAIMPASPYAFCSAALAPASTLDMTPPATMISGVMLMINSVSSHLQRHKGKASCRESLMCHSAALCSADRPRLAGWLAPGH